MAKCYGVLLFFCCLISNPMLFVGSLLGMGNELASIQHLAVKILIGMTLTAGFSFKKHSDLKLYEDTKSKTKAHADTLSSPQQYQ